MNTYFSLAAYALSMYATVSFAQKWYGSKTLEHEHKLGYSTLLYLVLEYFSYLVIAYTTLLFSNHGKWIVSSVDTNYYLVVLFSIVYFLAAIIITAIVGAVVDYFITRHFYRKRLKTKIDVDKAKQDLQSKL